MQRDIRLKGRIVFLDGEATPLPQIQLARSKDEFPNLALYMRDFVFDKLNTKLSEKDTPFRDTLNEYFHRYKIQKIKNHIEGPFMNMVDQFAIDRPFFKLQPRSSVVTAMDKKGVQAFFFDALGVEYLPYIQAKCEEYGRILFGALGWKRLKPPK